MSFKKKFIMNPRTNANFKDFFDSSATRVRWKPRVKSDRILQFKLNLCMNEFIHPLLAIVQMAAPYHR